MLNFVAINLTGFLVNTVFLAPRTGNSATPMIAQSGWLPRLLPSSTFNLGFVIALALLVAYHLWDRYTPLGFEARMTGLNARFSRAVGIDVPALIMKVMVLSGVIAGLPDRSMPLGCSTASSPVSRPATASLALRSRCSGGTPPLACCWARSCSARWLRLARRSSCSATFRSSWSMCCKAR